MVDGLIYHEESSCLFRTYDQVKNESVAGRTFVGHAVGAKVRGPAGAVKKSDFRKKKNSLVMISRLQNLIFGILDDGSTA